MEQIPELSEMSQSNARQQECDEGKCHYSVALLTHVFSSLVVLVNTKQLIGSWRSKRDLYCWLNINQQMLLPSYSRTNMDFLKSVLAGKKQLVKRSRVPRIAVPKYPELAVKALFPKILQSSPGIIDFFPDPETNKLPEAEFFYGILAAFDQKWLLDNIAEAEKRRLQARQLSDTGHVVEIKPAILQSLQASEFQSKTPGKGVFSLQKGCKARKSRGA